MLKAHLQRGHLFIKRILQAGNGLPGTFHKALGVYRREGISGVIERIKRVKIERTYARWISLYDQMDDVRRAAIREKIAQFRHKPFISVVMPVYNPRPEYLVEAIESVRRQLYPHWELCIADDASPNPEIRRLLEQYAQKDSRIKVVFRETNGHISAASNSALEVATGEWVALLDHDDVLPEHALYCVAEAIEKNPAVQMIYSDEDKINELGDRSDPYFEPDWNPDLFYSQNMFSHLGVYKKTLLDEIGGFRIEYNGAQDYDLALRCIERVSAQAIHHIPRVLYHWRIHAQSTAASADAKPYAFIAAERALNEHFARKNIAGRVEFIGYGYRVRYALPAVLPLVSLIIPTRNGFDLIKACVESILEKTTYGNYEILIVDNGSDDPQVLDYFAALQQNARIRVVRDDRPFNYPALNNAAVAQAKGEIVGLINNDIEVIEPDWLSEMVSLALQPGVGAVGAKLLYPNDTVQHAGVVLGLGEAGVAAHAHCRSPRTSYGHFGRAVLIASFSAVSAACLLVRKSIWLEVGGLNEKELAVRYNDIDFCLRVREAGYRNVWTPYALLYHHKSATRGYEDDPVKQARFAGEVAYMQKRWGALLQQDPAYNPNLSLSAEAFTLAWPPRVEAL